MGAESIVGNIINDIQKNLIGRGLNDIQKIFKDMALFFITYTIIIFLAGQWFGRASRTNSDAIWYPIYALIVVLTIKWLSDMGKPPKKEEKKK